MISLSEQQGKASGEGGVFEIRRSLKHRKDPKQNEELVA